MSKASERNRLEECIAGAMFSDDFFPMTDARWTEVVDKLYWSDRIERIEALVLGDSPLMT